MRFAEAAASFRPSGAALLRTARNHHRGATAREVELLQLVSDGLVNRESFPELFIPAFEKVKSHFRHLLAKLQAHGRAHAVAVGFRRGLIA